MSLTASGIWSVPARSARPAARSGSDDLFSLVDMIFPVSL
jgi:hypothetical protein